MKKLKNNQGVTMVEMLLAIIILLPLFTGGMLVFIKCVRLYDAEIAEQRLAGRPSRERKVEHLHHFGRVA